MTKFCSRAFFTGLALAGAALVTSTAQAQTTLAGVGIVIRDNTGGLESIVVPTDANGEVHLSELGSSGYEVSLIGGGVPIKVTVDVDGLLRLRAYTQTVRTSITPGGKVGQKRMTRNVVQRIENSRADTIDLRTTFIDIAPQPCDPLPGRADTCKREWRRNYININASSAADIVKLAPQMGMAAAEAIVAERKAGGPFWDLPYFANRVCPKVSVNFGQAAVRFDRMSVLTRGGRSPLNGLSCKAGSGEFELYGKKHNYVGHVTLLR